MPERKGEGGSRGQMGKRAMITSTSQKKTSSEKEITRSFQISRFEVEPCAAGTIPCFEKSIEGTNLEVLIQAI